MQKENITGSLLIFHHNPFQRGSEGEEDANLILRQLIYHYPSNTDDRSIEHLLGVVISLYTFTSLSLEGRKLEFVAWSNSKLSIRIVELDDKSKIFFVLREQEHFSDRSIARMLDFIINGVYFCVGEKVMKDFDKLKNYFAENGERLFNDVINIAASDESLINFAFSDVKCMSWHRSGVTATLMELMIMQTYKDVWGIVSFVNDMLLISHSPLEIIKLFKFVDKESKRTRVFLKRKNREILTNYKCCIAQIPDKDEIEADLIRVQQESVIFYLLVSPEISQETIDQINEIFVRSIPDILSGILDKTTTNYPSNSIVFNEVLDILKVGNITNEFRDNAILAHDSFLKNQKLRDIITHNSKSFSISMNILNVEHHASVKNNQKQTLEDMYEESLHVNPELQRFLQSLHTYQEP